MAASNHIKERSEEIQLLIASDSVQQAIKLLLDFIRDFSNEKEDINEVIVISSSYSRLEKAERRGVLPFEQVEMKRNQLLYQVLGLLDDTTNNLAMNIAA